MATNTLIDNAITLGETASESSNPTKTTLASTTSGVLLNVKITNGAMAGNVDHKITLRFATSPYDITAGAAVTELAHIAETLEMRFYRRNPSEEQIFQTDLQINNGGYLYKWFECPALGNDVTVDTTLVEI